MVKWSDFLPVIDSMALLEYIHRNAKESGICQYLDNGCVVDRRPYLSRIATNYYYRHTQNRIQSTEQNSE